MTTRTAGESNVLQFKHIVGETAAIEARGAALSAAIGDAEEAHGGVDELVGHIASAEFGSGSRFGQIGLVGGIDAEEVMALAKLMTSSEGRAASTRACTGRVSPSSTAV